MIGFKGIIENEGIKGCEMIIRHEGRIRFRFVCLPKFLDSKSHSDLRSQLHE